MYWKNEVENMKFKLFSIVWFALMALGATKLALGSDLTNNVLQQQLIQQQLVLPSDLPTVVTSTSTVVTKVVTKGSTATVTPSKPVVSAITSPTFTQQVGKFTVEIGSTIKHSYNSVQATPFLVPHSSKSPQAISIFNPLPLMQGYTNTPSPVSTTEILNLSNTNSANNFNQYGGYPYLSEEHPMQDLTQNYSSIVQTGNQTSHSSARLGIIYNNELADFGEFWPPVYCRNNIKHMHCGGYNKDIRPLKPNRNRGISLGSDLKYPEILSIWGQTSNFTPGVVSPESFAAHSQPGYVLANANSSSKTLNENISANAIVQAASLVENLRLTLGSVPSYEKTGGQTSHSTFGIVSSESKSTKYAEGPAACIGFPFCNPFPLPEDWVQQVYGVRPQISY